MDLTPCQQHGSGEWNVSNSVFNSSEVRTCNESESNPVMPELPMYLLVITTSLYIIIFISGTVGNVMVVVAVSLERSMHSSTNLFLVNLAVADLMVILIAMPTALTEVFAKDEWYFGHVMCKLVPVLENSVAQASVLTMLVISVERFQAICHPLKLRHNKLFSRSIKWVIIIILWLVSIICCVPFLYIAVYRDSRHLDGTPIKVCRQYTLYSWQKAYVAALFVVFFVVPLFIMAMLYGFVVQSLKLKTQVLEKENSKSCHTRQNSRKKVIIMSVTITVLFFILHSPLRIGGMWMTFTHSSQLNLLGFEGMLNLICFIRVMFYLNSCVNPIVYAIVSSKFRQAFRNICCRKKPAVERGVSWDSSPNKMYTRMQSLNGRPTSLCAV